MSVQCLGARSDSTLAAWTPGRRRAAAPLDRYAVHHRVPNDDRFPDASGDEPDSRDPGARRFERSTQRSCRAAKADARPLSPSCWSIPATRPCRRDARRKASMRPRVARRPGDARKGKESWRLAAKRSGWLLGASHRRYPRGSRHFLVGEAADRCGGALRQLRKSHPRRLGLGGGRHVPGSTEHGPLGKDAYDRIAVHPPGHLAATGRHAGGSARRRGSSLLRLRRGQRRENGDRSWRPGDVGPSLLGTGGTSEGFGATPARLADAPREPLAATCHEDVPGGRWRRPFPWLPIPAGRARRPADGRTARQGDRSTPAWPAVTLDSSRLARCRPCSPSRPREPLSVGTPSRPSAPARTGPDRLTQGSRAHAARRLNSSIIVVAEHARLGHRRGGVHRIACCRPSRGAGGRSHDSRQPRSAGARSRRSTATSSPRPHAGRSRPLHSR